MDRATALKAVFDGAMMLDCLSSGQFDVFQFERIVDVSSDKRYDRPSEGNVLVEPFDRQVSAVATPHKIIVNGRYGTEEMILQARYDAIAKGLLKHLGFNGPDFRTLYSLVDWMKTEGWTEEQIAEVTGQRAGVVNDFTRTANNETVLGPLARHGAKGWQAPITPVLINDAQGIVLPAAKAFLLSRAHCFDATGTWPSVVHAPKAAKRKR